MPDQTPAKSQDYLDGYRDASEAAAAFINEPADVAALEATMAEMEAEEDKALRFGPIPPQDRMAWKLVCAIILRQTLAEQDVSRLEELSCGTLRDYWSDIREARWLLWGKFT
jgi:hypothetical protein